MVLFLTVIDNPYCCLPHALS